MKRPTHASTSASGAPRVIVSLGISAAIVIVAVAFAIYFVTVRGPLDIAHGVKEESFDSANRMADGFKKMFNANPQITVNGTTVVEQAGPVMELATVKREVAEHYQWSQSWFGSTKTMELQGIYETKAGFDLHEPFRISVEGGRIKAVLPRPKLLSVEMTGYKVLVDDNGWWNKISPEDRENAMGAMQREAREKAEQSGILNDAKAKFKEQFLELAKAQNISVPVETEFQGDAPVPVVPPGK